MQSLSIYISESLKRVGRGAEGIVYDLGDGTVKKVFYRGTVPLSWQLLYRAQQMGVKTRTLPVVYEVGEDYVIRENCKPKTSKCREYYKASQHRRNGETLYRMALDNKRPKLDGTDKEVYKWMVRLKYEISQLGGYGLGDFALKNFGETKDGRVVMLDF